MLCGKFSERMLKNAALAAEVHMDKLTTDLTQERDDSKSATVSSME
jgi:hypothetical protein